MPRLCPLSYWTCCVPWCWYFWRNWGLVEWSVPIQNGKWEFPPSDTIYKQIVMALNWNPCCSWCHSKNRWLLLSHYGFYGCERRSLFWTVSHLFLSHPSTCESEVCLWLSFLLSVYLWRLKAWVFGRSCHICLIWPSQNEIPEGSQAANYPVLCTC